MILLAQVVRVSVISSSRHVAHVSSSLILFDLPFYFHLSFPVFFLSSVLMYPDLHTDLDNLDSVTITCTTPPRGATTSTTSPTPSQVMSPKTRSPNELVDSQGPFSYVTPSSDQDIDDTALGKLLTEAHRE